MTHIALPISSSRKPYCFAFGRLARAVGFASIAALTMMTGMASGAVAEPVGSSADANAATSAAPKQHEDPLTRARISAVDGKYTECAALSDKARKMPNAHWRAHQVYASCKVFAADAQKDTMEPRAYAQEMADAIGALDFLLNTPGVIPQHDRRQGLKAMRNQIKARADKVMTPSSGSDKPAPAPRQF